MLKTVPSFLKYQQSPLISYTSISTKILNFKRVIKDIDFTVGTTNITCSSSPFKYAPVGHVITGNLNTIEDNPLRMLLKRGPHFREQNNINWIMNRCICREADRKYKESCESVDIPFCRGLMIG